MIVLAITITAIVAIVITTYAQEFINRKINVVISTLSTATSNKTNMRCIEWLEHSKEFRAWFCHRKYASLGMDVEISSEFKEKVLAIIRSDPDASTLLEEGYNVTRIIPVIRYVVQGDGVVTMKATSAVVEMVKPGTGRAHVYVDIASETVVKIAKCEIVIKSATPSITPQQSMTPSRTI